MNVRLTDKSLGKVLYLYVSQAEAEQHAVLLGRGHLERFKAEMHESELGWYVKDRESGRIIDAQGLVQ